MNDFEWERYVEEQTFNHMRETIAEPDHAWFAELEQNQLDGILALDRVIPEDRFKPQGYIDEDIIRTAPRGWANQRNPVRPRNSQRMQSADCALQQMGFSPARWAKQRIQSAECAMQQVGLTRTPYRDPLRAEFADQFRKLDYLPHAMAKDNWPDEHNMLQMCKTNNSALATYAVLSAKAAHRDAMFNLLSRVVEEDKTLRPEDSYNIMHVCGPKDMPSPSEWEKIGVKSKDAGTQTETDTQTETGTQTHAQNQTPPFTSPAKLDTADDATDDVEMDSPTGM